MATFIKRGTKWIAQLYVKGKRSSKSFDTKNEAKDWARVEEHRMKQSKNILLGKTLGDAFLKYADEETPRKKGARWEAIRLKKLGRDTMASKQLADLEAWDFEDFIKRGEKAGLKGSSINRELEILCTVLNKAISWKWLTHSPLTGVKRPNNPPHRKVIILPEQRDNILIALNYAEDKPVNSPRQKIAVAFLLALESAMRYGEIWGLDWKYIDWVKCAAHLPDTKNGDPHDVPLSMRAIALLQKLGPPRTSGRVIDTNPRSSEVIFRRAVELAGYKGLLHFHDTRHTALTNLAKIFPNPLDLAKISNHRNVNQLMTYHNPTVEDLARRMG